MHLFIDEAKTESRFRARQMFLERKNETDPAKLKTHFEEGEAIIYVLRNEVMQLTVSETDESGNPTMMQANIRPELLRDPPDSCPAPLPSAKEMAQQRKEKKKQEQQEKQEAK